MGELRAKHSREEEEGELARLGCTTSEGPGNDLLVTLATLTIWKVSEMRGKADG